LLLSPAIAQVVINEFSAANYNSIPDNFGEYEDWIELYNAGSSAENISGYYLSDRADRPTKWELPAGSVISPGGFLRVWCSRKDGVFGGHYHSNFKLTQTRASEGVYLFDPAGMVVDSNGIDIPNQATHSWGRYPDGGSDWKVFTSPTPNNSNASTPRDAYATTPILSAAPGYYAGPTTLTMSSPDPSVTIHYTLDGSTPTGVSPVYSGSINISATTVVRAIAVSSDPAVLNSFIETNTYMIGANHTIKVVSLAGEQIDNLLNGSWLEPIGSFELFDEAGLLMAEAVGDYNEHGNDSWAYPQRGIDCIMRDQLGYDHAVQAKVFSEKDRKKFQRLILKAAANDNYPFETGAHIRDAYVHMLSMWADLKVDERTSENVIVYCNGQYWGVYELREKVDDHDFTDYYYDQGEEDIDFIKTWGATWEEYGSRADWDALANYIIVQDMAIAANYDYVKERYNTGSLIDYTILHSWIVCADWLNWNTAWWRGRNPDGDKKKWRYALWDDDASFGHYINYTGVPDVTAFADPCDPQTLSSWSDPEGHMTLLNNLFVNDDFYDDYINRWADLLNYHFHCDYAIPFLDSMIAKIDPEMPDQISRWGGSIVNWEAQVNVLRTFISDRCGYLITGMEDCYGEEAYDVTLIVDPPMSGEIDINSLEPPFFPFAATYFSGVEIDLDADAFAGYEFDYWETVNNPVADISAEETTIELVAGDTIIAHFKEDVIPFYDIHILVNPPGSGTVTLNAVELVSYPFDGSYLSGTTIDVTANASPGYSFDYWDLYDQLINPSPLDDNAFFSIATGDTLIANFRLGTGVDENNSPLTSVSLYPTVSSGFVQMDFNLEEGALAEIQLMSTTGQYVATLQDAAYLAPGDHYLNFDLSAFDLSAGIYLISLQTEGYIHTEKVVYSK
jgi:hypothetical protein